MPQEGDDNEDLLYTTQQLDDWQQVDTFPDEKDAPNVLCSPLVYAVIWSALDQLEKQITAEWFRSFDPCPLTV